MKRLSALMTAAVLVAGGATATATAASAAARTRTLVVSPDGSDSAAGTPSAPLRTIQRAVQRLRAGGVVRLRGGVYHQRVTLRGVRHLTIRPYRHERPVISGAGLTPPAGRSALIDVANSRDVTVR